MASIEEDEKDFPTCYFADMHLTVYCREPAVPGCAYCAMHELLYRAEHDGKGTNPQPPANITAYFDALNKWERNYNGRRARGAC